MKLLLVGGALALALMAALDRAPSSPFSPEPWPGSVPIHSPR
ncbi:hypothetical protein [Caulobacter endophyticus]|nr:hypothetical protein [Caulobacter endophyticus]MDG2531857.1 hypothetical protein [Caulobacter endophyticus]